MFRTIARLRERLKGGVEFHYIGTSDPHRFAEFAAIEDITVRHGFKDAAGMAATLASAHAGILTSEFEGMPRFVLETLAVGRPVVAMHLPQLEAVIHDGESGFLVPRTAARGHGRDARATVYRRPRAIEAGEMDPVKIAGTIESSRRHTARAGLPLHQEIQMRAAWPPRGGLLRAPACEYSSAHQRIRPAMGGIGTYAREIAAAATRLGAKVTVVAPDYAQQTHAEDRSLPFEVIRFRGGLHSHARSSVANCACARGSPRAMRYDIVHAADWPFFIPLALVAAADAGAPADDRARHRDQRDADAAEAPRDPRRWRFRTANGGRRQQPLYA